MSRDGERFPADAVGDELWSYRVGGDHLVGTRDVTFTLEMPTVTSTASFLDDLEESFPDRHPDCVRVQTLDITLELVPDHATVSAVVELLEELADEHEADFVGWAFVPVR